MTGDKWPAERLGALGALMLFAFIPWSIVATLLVVGASAAALPDKPGVVGVIGMAMFTLGIPWLGVGLYFCGHPPGSGPKRTRRRHDR